MYIPRCFSFFVTTVTSSSKTLGSGNSTSRFFWRTSPTDSDVIEEDRENKRSEVRGQREVRMNSTSRFFWRTSPTGSDVIEEDRENKRSEVGDKEMCEWILLPGFSEEHRRQAVMWLKKTGKTNEVKLGGKWKKHVAQCMLAQAQQHLLKQNIFEVIQPPLKDYYGSFSVTSKWRELNFDNNIHLAFM